MSDDDDDDDDDDDGGGGGGGGPGGCCRICPRESEPFMSLLQTRASEHGTVRPCVR